MRGLESEFGESSNSIRLELNRFEEAGLLYSLKEGNKKFYRANEKHPLFRDIHSMLLKESGIDQVVEKVVHRVGDLQSIYLTGNFARGIDSPVIELIFTGAGIDREYLSMKVVQAEELCGRKVSFVVLEPGESETYISRLNGSVLLLWSSG